MRRDLIALPDNSKVWIYQCTEFIPEAILENIQSEVIAFTNSWASHNIPLECYGHIFHNRFLVLVADESNHVSGCSIDSSVHFIENLGQKYHLDFFDRLNFLYFKEDEIMSVHHAEFKNALESGLINENTKIFNNLVSTKKEFIHAWITALKNSWHKKYLVS